MAALLLPLRLDSDYEHWWFVAPIDWAAANGQPLVVRALLSLDPSLFRNLTSKRRLRRLEKLWDDPLSFSLASSGRAHVVKHLLLRTPDGFCGLRFGAWALYVAASAGDASLLHLLLSSHPYLVHGDAEFGISDLLYAAARGGNLSIFRTLISLARYIGWNPGPDVPHCSSDGAGPLDLAAQPSADFAIYSSEVAPAPLPDTTAVHSVLDFAREGFDYDEGIAAHTNSRYVLTKALLAAARAGSVRAVEEVVKGMDAQAMVLTYRDSNGATALHAAAGRGHLKVVKLILETCPESVTVQDANQNTALHTAARRGCVQVAMELMKFHRELIYMRNRNGETPLHSAVKGTKQAPPRSIMKQGGKEEMVKQILAFENGAAAEYVNWKTGQGQTALHLSVATVKIDDKLVSLLLKMPGIRVNEVDEEGRTAMDTARICKEANPVAEFRCNIAMSLLSAAASRSMDKSVLDDACTPSSLLRGFAEDPGLEIVKSESVGSTDEKILLSRNLTFVKLPCSQESEAASDPETAGSPFPTTQCFSVMQSLLLPGRKFCRNAGIRNRSSKKWDNHSYGFWQQGDLADADTPQRQDLPLRHRFTTIHRRHEMGATTDCHHIRVSTPSERLSPVLASLVTSPTSGREGGAQSPPFLKSGIKAFFHHLRSPQPLPCNVTHRKSKLATSFSSRNTSDSDLHGLDPSCDLVDSLDHEPFPITESNELHDDPTTTSTHLDHRFSAGRPSVHMCNQCFCLDFFNGLSHKSGNRASEAADSPNGISTPANSDYSNAESEENHQQVQYASDTDSDDGVLQSSALYAMHRASSSGSSQNSTPRPSASLSLSPWLSPTLRAARRKHSVATTNVLSGSDQQCILPLASSSLDSTGHAHAGFSSNNNLAPHHCQHHLKSKHDSFGSLCSCFQGECFLDHYLDGNGEDDLVEQTSRN